MWLHVVVGLCLLLHCKSNCSLSRAKNGCIACCSRLSYKLMLISCCNADSSFLVTKFRVSE